MVIDDDATDDGAVIAMANTFGMLEAQAERIWGHLEEWQRPILREALERMHWRNAPTAAAADDDDLPF